LPGSAVLRTVAEVVSHIDEHAQDNAGWVLKANYGMSGRERTLGRGNQLAEPVLNWIRKRCVQGGVVYEPWLERIDEAGLQWNIPKDGEPQLLGITPLMSDAIGTYRGSLISGSDAELGTWKSAVGVTRQVMQRLQEHGYFGPVGIDAMHYRAASDEILCRPVQDLNARYTMGRLALGLKRFVPAGHNADWLHSAEMVSQAVADDPTAKVMQTTARSWLVIRDGVTFRTTTRAIPRV
jgi:hypothetical protein